MQLEYQRSLTSLILRCEELEPYEIKSYRATENGLSFHVLTSATFTPIARQTDGNLIYDISMLMGEWDFRRDERVGIWNHVFES